MSNAISPARAKMPKEQYFDRRYKKARATADLWQSILEACQHYTVSSRNLFYWTSQYQGAQKNAKVFDTTAVAAVRKFVSKVQNAITPPQMTWAMLKAGDSVDEQFKEELDKELQRRTDIIFSYIRHSNFDTANHEALQDVAIGTGALICAEGPDDDPLRWSSVPLARLAMEESVSGLIESNYRWWDEIRIDDILAIWPNANLSPTMADLYKNDPNASVKQLVEGCIDNMGYGTKKYTYFVMHENHLLIDEDSESSPWIVFRWSKVNNEMYGRGPVIEALPTILTLNELARLELTTANFNACKPWMASNDGVFNPETFVLNPNTVIPVARNNDGSWPIAAFPDNSPPTFVQLTAIDLRNQINVLLYADPLGPVDGPTKTATELALRQRNLAEEIGPPFTRLQKEYLSRIIDRVIFILQKKGLLEKLVINGKEIQIQYQSPIVIAQGQQNVANLTQYIQLIQGIYGQEAAVMYFDPIKLPFWIRDEMGVNPNIFNTEDKLKEVFASQSEMQQEKEMMMFQMEGMNAGQ